MNEWISVKDRLPEIEDYYIVSVEFFEKRSGRRYRKSYCATYSPVCDDPSDEGVYWFEGWLFSDDICEDDEIHITHWQPLPEPPK